MKRVFDTCRVANSSSDSRTRIARLAPGVRVIAGHCRKMLSKYHTTTKKQQQLLLLQQKSKPRNANINIVNILPFHFHIHNLTQSAFTSHNVEVLKVKVIKDKGHKTAAGLQSADKLITKLVTDIKKGGPKLQKVDDGLTPWSDWAECPVAAKTWRNREKIIIKNSNLEFAVLGILLPPPKPWR